MQTVDWIEISKALITPAIALLGVWIAFSQYNSNELKRRHELFDRRWKIYDATLSFLYIFSDFNVPSDTYWTDEVNKFLIGTAGSKFIFDEAIYNYINRIYSDSIQYGILYTQIQERLASSLPEERKELVELKGQLEGIGYYLGKQFESGCNEKFSKFMDLETGPIEQKLKAIWKYLKVLSHKLRGK